MADTRITDLAAAAALDGSELVPVVQDGSTVQATAGDIAALAGAGGGVVAAEDVTLTPTGGISSSDLQAAIAELDTEKSGTSHTHAHSATTGITANDHHAQAHAISGGDHTGTLAHTALSSVGPDDHHGKSHGHTGADGSGTVAHSATTGKTANDHHAQAHTDSDHSDGANIKAAIGDAAGDLIGFSADNAPVKIPAGAAKQHLRMNAAANGQEWVDPMGSVVSEAHADVTANNTTAEVDLVNLTLPGGSVAAGDLVRLVTAASLLNSTGSNVNFTFRLKLGATTILNSSGVALTSDGSRRSVILVANFYFPSAASEIVGAILTIGGGAAAGTWAAAGTSRIGHGSATENTATDKALKLTVQMNTASASAEFVAHSAALELIRKR